MSCEVDSVPRGIVSQQRKETIQKQHIVRSVLTHQQYFHGRLFLAACYLAALAGHEVTSDLGPPTCDLLSETFMQHTSTPAFTSSLYLPPQLFFHPLFPGSRFVPVGRYCIMAESWLSNQLLVHWLWKISKTTETLEVLLQGLKLYLASYFLKQVHTCTARSIFSLFFFIMIFLPSAQISHILCWTGLSPDLKYTNDWKETSVMGGGGKSLLWRVHTFSSSKI